jgi:polyisoprenoid-binding protein YceI
MKKILFPILTIAVLSSCNNAPKGEEATTTQAQEVVASNGTPFKIDASTSNVGFLGSKPIGSHTGFFKLTDGELSVAENKLNGGSFTIDINSMTITDKDLTYAEKLKTHLLSPDFFDAEKFGVAKFEITGVEILENDTTGSHKVSGNLTLKESKQNVTFPANM